MTPPAEHLLIRPADPQGPEALALLQMAAAEARALYPELHNPQAPPPTSRRTATAANCGACWPARWAQAVRQWRFRLPGA